MKSQMHSKAEDGVLLSNSSMVIAISQAVENLDLIPPQILKGSDSALTQ